ncbi:hypothetical protein OEZ86_012473 [Tetradesmus obliquus]|nr:hypothetical protein OEZ86_012473 [Tetradesmus obliquus]
MIDLQLQRRFEGLQMVLLRSRPGCSAWRRTSGSPLLLLLLLAVVLLAAHEIEAAGMRGLLSIQQEIKTGYVYESSGAGSAPPPAPAPAARPTLAQTIEQLWARSRSNPPPSTYNPPTYTYKPKVYNPPPTPSIPSYCNVQPQMNPICPGYKKDTPSQLPASTPAYSGPPRKPSEYTFSYSLSLVDDILNNPDAAVQDILRAMDGNDEKVQSAVNGLLKAAETSPQKAADVLAKLAAKDPDKYAKFIAELSRAAMGLGPSYRRTFTIVISFGFGSAVIEQSVQPFSLGLARDIAFGKAASARDWSPSRNDADIVISPSRVKLYGEAFAAAAAGGQASRDGLVAATAAVYCSGSNAYAEAWAAAYSEVLRVDTNGCLILEKAFAAARAMCVNGHAFAVSTSTASKQVLTCGITAGPGIIAQKSGTASGTKTITGPGIGSASWPGIASQPAQPAAAIGSGSALANPQPAAGFVVPAGGGSGAASAMAASSSQASGGAAAQSNALANGLAGMTGFNGMMMPGFVGPNGMPGMTAGAGSTAAATSNAYSSSSSSGSGSSNAMAVSGATAG